MQDPEVLPATAENPRVQQISNGSSTWQGWGTVLLLQATDTQK